MSRDKFNVKMNILLIETEAEDYSDFNRNLTDNIQGNSCKTQCLSFINSLTIKELQIQDYEDTRNPRRSKYAKG